MPSPGGIKGFPALREAAEFCRFVLFVYAQQDFAFQPARVKKEVLSLCLAEMQKELYFIIKCRRKSGFIPAPMIELVTRDPDEKIN